MSVKKAIFRIGVVFAVAVAVALMGCKKNPVSGEETIDPSAPVTIGSLTWTKNVNIETLDSWCYNNSPDSCTKYGRLYIWEAAKSACENMEGGWRLPTNEDWDSLFSYVGGKDSAGIKLKSQTGWGNAYGGGSGNGTDNYGFSVLPGGNRYTSGAEFYGCGSRSSFWSATETDFGGAYFYRFLSDKAYVDESDYPKGDIALSVRCVQDAP